MGGGGKNMDETPGHIPRPYCWRNPVEGHPLIFSCQGCWQRSSVCCGLSCGLVGSSCGSNDHAVSMLEWRQ